MYLITVDNSRVYWIKLTHGYGSDGSIQILIESLRRISERNHNKFPDNFLRADIASAPRPGSEKANSSAQTIAW